jgi:hypothetical protein
MTPAATRAVWIVAACVLVVPLWASPFVPLQDLAAHDEMACQLGRVLAGTDDRLTLSPFPWPNSAAVWLLAALQTVLPAYTATKLLLSVALVTWPLSLAWVCRRASVSPLWALVALPTAWDLSFSFGFLQFLLAKPLAAVLLARVVWPAEPRARRVAVDAALWLLLFTTHSFAFLATVFAASLVLFFTLTPTATRRSSLFSLLSLFLAFVPTLLFFFKLTPTAETFRWVPFAAWRSMHDVMPMSFVDDIAWWLLAAVVVVRLRRAHTTVAAIGAVLLCIAAFGPVHVPRVEVVSPRAWSVGVALLIVAVGGARAPRWVLAAVLLLCTMQAARMTTTWRAFSEQLGPFEKLLVHVPREATFAVDLHRRTFDGVPNNAFWHWSKLACGVGGPSFSDDTFARRATSTVRLVPGTVLPNTTTAAFVVTDAATPPRPDMRKVATAGRFTLWQQR